MVRYVIETTPACMRTQFLLFACAEGAVPHRAELKEPGYFGRLHAMVGPRLLVDGEPHLELNVQLRRVGLDAPRLVPTEAVLQRDMESFLELQATWLRPAGVRVFKARRQGSDDADARETISRCLRRMNDALEARPWLAGTFSLADCTAPFLFEAASIGIDLTGFPRVVDYLERIRQRPALNLARDEWSSLAANS